MKRIVASLLLLSALAVAQVDTCDVVVYVRDANTKRPVKDAVVRFDRFPHIEMRTSATGIVYMGDGALPIGAFPCDQVFAVGVTAENYAAVQRVFKTFPGPKNVASCGRQIYSYMVQLGGKPEPIVSSGGGGTPEPDPGGQDWWALGCERKTYTFDRIEYLVCNHPRALRVACATYKCYSPKGEPIDGPFVYEQGAGKTDKKTVKLGGSLSRDGILGLFDFGITGENTNETTLSREAKLSGTVGSTALPGREGQVCLHTQLVNLWFKVTVRKCWWESGPGPRWSWKDVPLPDESFEAVIGLCTADLTKPCK